MDLSTDAAPKPLQVERGDDSFSAAGVFRHAFRVGASHA